MYFIRMIYTEMGMFLYFIENSYIHVHVCVNTLIFLLTES